MNFWIIVFPCLMFLSSLGTFLGSVQAGGSTRC